MEASGSIVSSSQARVAVFLEDQISWLRGLLVASAISSATLLFAFSGLVALRRFLGGLQSAPGLPTLVAVGFLLAALSSVVHCGAQLLWGKNSAAYRAAQGLLPLSLAVAVFSISLPGSSFFAVLFVSLILGCEELFWLVRPALLRPALHRDGAEDRPAYRDSPSEKVVRTEKDFMTVNEFHADFPPEVSRRIERTVGPAGEDICWGQIRSQFLPGQRTAAIHLEFCPPFQRSPVLHVEQVEGPDATVKTTQILPYGARLEVRLAHSGSEFFETRIEFSAIVEKDKDEGA